MKTGTLLIGAAVIGGAIYAFTKAKDNEQGGGGGGGNSGNGDDTGSSWSPAEIEFLNTLRAQTQARYAEYAPVTVLKAAYVKVTDALRAQYRLEGEIIVIVEFTTPNGTFFDIYVGDRSFVSIAIQTQLEQMMTINDVIAVYTYGG